MTFQFYFLLKNLCYTPILIVKLSRPLNLKTAIPTSFTLLEPFACMSRI